MYRLDVMDAAGSAHVGAPSPRRGIAYGLAGHALATLVFLGVFLLDPEDPADRAAAAVGLSVLTGVVGSVVTLGLALRRSARGHRDRTLAGMLTAWAVGAVIGAIAAGFVLVTTSDWSDHCPCEAPISVF
ncbi:urate hydroxylase PuuD [Micromonospora sp. MP36]|uniref:urate hydroxylase PuuD n=1 Tax=Micromonospora sp. MP36 TaxID=2604468 RepID=UPI0011E6F019|nr:urate hydroxylase PuuD [Micromonospora sp. MP36]